jgi:hypothetical protein
MYVPSLRGHFYIIYTIVIFLNNKFLFTIFNQQKFFSLTNYCYQYDLLSDLYDIMDIENKPEDEDLEYASSEKNYFVAAAGLIQSIVISLNESLNKYPKTIGNQICAKINCLNGLSEDFSIFIRDSINYLQKIVR